MASEGYLAEVMYMVEVMSKGMTVSKPYSDSAEYDFIVDCGGRLSRVQVKLITTPEKNTTNYRCSLTRNKGEKYKKVDVFAIYLEPENIWFNVPMENLNGKTIRLSPKYRRSRYNKFKENWTIYESQT